MTAAALQILRAAEEEAEEHESRKSLHIARLGEPFVVQKKGALLGTATGSMSGSSKGGSNSRKSIAGGRGFVRVGVPQAGPELGSDSAKIFQYELESLPDDDEDDNRSLESLPDDSADESDQGRRISPKPVVTRPVSSISRPISMSRLAPEDSKSDLLLTDRSRGMLQSSKEVSDSHM